MELDIIIHKGRPDKPAVILIHGLGMDKDFWVAPLDTKIFVRNVPLKIFAATRPRPCAIQKRKKLTVGNIPQKIDNLWTSLVEKEFNTICWSQRRPVGPISAAVEELNEIMCQVKSLFSKRPVALIGHSRGGLIARKLLEKKIPEIKALITLSTPHAGSGLAQFGRYLAPISAALRSMLPRNTHGTVAEVIKRFSELVEGNGTKELLPGSEFYKNLKDSPVEGVNYLSFGGTKTKLLTVYKWKKKDEKIYPNPLFTIPDSLLKVFPASNLPYELRPGKGDLLVSVKSSMLPWASRHYNMPLNHISITWNKKVNNIIIEALDKI